MTVAETLSQNQVHQVSSPWIHHLAVLGSVVLGLIFVFRGDAIEMGWIWWDSSTFNHCLLILPIIGWLVWNRRTELAQLEPSLSPWGLAIIALGACSWLVGEAASVASARHLGLVVMIQGSVVAILGMSVARGLLFPLVYALFLVPFGEEFVPFLQSITAELSMILLGLFGLPAHIEGVFITTPSGYFEVAEACSGVKFLIAMIALGALTANLCFRSWWRRISFLAVCIIVPIVANGIRAFGTIYIADTNGMDFAESFDHVVYGWFFFAFVIAAVFALSWKFFDREIDEPAFDPAALKQDGAIVTSMKTLSLFAVVSFAIALSPTLWMTASAAQGRADVPAYFELPQVDGWESSDAPMAYPWEATYVGADRIAQGRYQDADGRVVDLAIAYYTHQAEGRELVGFGQGGFPVETEWSWIENSLAPPSGRAYRIMAPGPLSRDVIQYEQIGGWFAESSAGAKLETMRLRLLGGDQSAMGIVISAEGENARAAMENFLADAGGIETLVDRVTGLVD